jgi:hypothetical protein
MRHGDGGASKHHIRDGVAEALPTRAARQQGCPDFRVQGRFKTPVFSIFSPRVEDTVRPTTVAAIGCCRRFVSWKKGYD